MLLDHHLAELRRSGLTDEIIKAAGINSGNGPPEAGGHLEPQKLAACLRPRPDFSFP